MMINRKISFGFLPALLLLVVVCLPSCTDKPVNHSLPDGSNLRLSASLTTPAMAQDIDFFVLTVTGPDFAPIVLNSGVPDSTEEAGIGSITSDGHAIYASVSVPVGENRVFSLEAYSDGSESEPVMLYRGVTVVSVRADQVTNVHLMMEPTAPMVRLSPRWLNIGAGDQFDVGIQVANIPNLGYLELEFTFLRDTLEPISAERSETLDDNVLFVSGFFNDGMDFMVVAGDSSGGQAINASGVLDLGTVHCWNRAQVTEPLVDSITSWFRITNLVAGDVDGNLITYPQIYTDPVEVNIGLIPDQVVTFPDSALDLYIRNNNELPPGPIYLSSLLGITYVSINELGVSDFTGMEYLRNLRTFYMSYNSVLHVGYLSEMKRLQYFYAQGCGIVNISGLQELNAMSSLVLSYNQITTITALQGMTSLFNLDLTDNQISNIQPLSGLTYLRYLGLEGNQIVDIGPLAGLEYMYDLDLSNNQIVDISALRHLENLRTVALNDNLIEDLLPLVQNPGIDSGDVVDIWRNNGLVNDEQQQDYIRQLRNREVIVREYEPVK